MQRQGIALTVGYGVQIAPLGFGSELSRAQPAAIACPRHRPKPTARPRFPRAFFGVGDGEHRERAVFGKREAVFYLLLGVADRSDLEWVWPAAASGRTAASHDNGAARTLEDGSAVVRYADKGEFAA